MLLVAKRQDLGLQRGEDSSDRTEQSSVFEIGLVSPSWEARRMRGIKWNN